MHSEMADYIAGLLTPPLASVWLHVFLVLVAISSCVFAADSEALSLWYIRPRDLADRTA
jgi:hypothetical protein